MFQNQLTTTQLIIARLIVAPWPINCKIIDILDSDGLIKQAKLGFMQDSCRGWVQEEHTIQVTPEANASMHNILLAILFFTYM